MELKQDKLTCGTHVRILLIVPYGIETIYTEKEKEKLWLLIVPYGIETKHVRRHCSVPSLLIVPYGIETSDCTTQCYTTTPFNRTLWN